MAAQRTVDHHPQEDRVHQMLRRISGAPASAMGRRMLSNARPLVQFFNKINADSVFNLAGLLAYNFLTSIFPLMLVLLAVAGLIIGSLSPVGLQSVESALSRALPPSLGSTLVTAVMAHLRKSAGVILVIGVLSSIFGGSRLFVTMEFCFGVIYRLGPRKALPQNLIAIGMTLALAIGGPVVFLASSLPTALIHQLKLGAVGSFMAQVIGVLLGFGVALVFFGFIYWIVPNKLLAFKSVWRGALLAAALLVIFEAIFPLYESLVLRPSSFGSLAGFALLFIAFLYYLSVILLIGAELNAWQLGVRDPTHDFVSYLRDQAITQQQRQAQKRDQSQPEHADFMQRIFWPIACLLMTSPIEQEARGNIQ
ncbi:MAG TPA: YihY/virulence factor BrkB family protein [Ktedonobacterales bacterium]|nr:YihY/virulence factor BrkB family protein [Ktedonobacterales bacterium]